MNSRDFVKEVDIVVKLLWAECHTQFPFKSSNSLFSTHSTDYILFMSLITLRMTQIMTTKIRRFILVTRHLIESPYTTLLYNFHNLFTIYY